MNDIQKQFEAWAKSNGYEVNRSNICYVNMFTEVAWQAWQASRSALVVELPKFYSETEHNNICITSDVEHALSAAGIEYK